MSRDTTLGFTFAGPEAPHLQLADYLREKDVLLVLDNCEHLPLAGFVIELLERAPRLTILATSRASLNVRGEQVLELAGLPFPRSRAGAPADWGSYAAVELFRSYAQAGSPQLSWTPGCQPV